MRPILTEKEFKQMEDAIKTFDDNDINGIYSIIDRIYSANNDEKNDHSICFRNHTCTISKQEEEECKKEHIPLPIYLTYKMEIAIHKMNYIRLQCLDPAKSFLDKKARLEMTLPNILTDFLKYEKEVNKNDIRWSVIIV